MLPCDVFNPNYASLFAFVMGPVVGLRLLHTLHTTSQPHRLHHAIQSKHAEARHSGIPAHVALQLLRREVFPQGQMPLQ